MRYGIEDLVKEDKPGVFAKGEPAAMHGELMAQGGASAEDALQVSQTIEKKEDLAGLADAPQRTQRIDLNGSFRTRSRARSGAWKPLAFEANLSGTCLNTIRNWQAAMPCGPGR